MTVRDPSIDATPGSSSEVPGVGVPSPGAPATVTARDPRSKGRRLFDASLPLLMLLAIAVIDFPICPTRLLFGLPCPGCGLTRATLAMLSLDLATMLQLHPLAPIMAPVVGWVLGKPILEELGWIPKHRVFIRVPQAVWIALTIAFFGLYVARLAGLFGGLPDPVDPAHSVVGEMFGFVTHSH